MHYIFSEKLKQFISGIRATPKGIQVSYTAAKTFAIKSHNKDIIDGICEMINIDDSGNLAKVISDEFHDFPVIKM